VKRVSIVYFAVAQEVPAAQPLTEPCYCLNDGECVTVSENADNPSRVHCKCKQGEYFSSTCNVSCTLPVLLSSGLNMVYLELKTVNEC